MTTHKRLRELAKAVPKKDSDSAFTHSSECSICLMSIAVSRFESKSSFEPLTDSSKPCQSLFVAPCSHVWHYKCIRPILNDHKTWPQFLCPNCRAVTDLEAEVDDPNDEDWEDEEHEVELNRVETHGTNAVPSISEHNDEDVGNAASTSRLLSIRNGADESPISPVFPMDGIPDSSDIAATPRETSLLSRRAARRISPPEGSLGNGSQFSASPFRSPEEHNPTFGHYLRPITPTQPLLQDEEMASNGGSPPAQLSGPNAAEMLIADGPMTPTNNAGPFVFDGSAGRRAATSLETEASA